MPRSTHWTTPISVGFAICGVLALVAAMLALLALGGHGSHDTQITEESLA